MPKKQTTAARKARAAAREGQSIADAAAAIAVDCVAGRLRPDNIDERVFALS